MSLLKRALGCLAVGAAAIVLIGGTASAATAPPPASPAAASTTPPLPAGVTPITAANATPEQLAQHNAQAAPTAGTAAPTSTPAPPAITTNATPIPSSLPHSLRPKLTAPKVTTNGLGSADIGPQPMLVLYSNHQNLPMIFGHNNAEDIGRYVAQNRCMAGYENWATTAQQAFSVSAILLWVPANDTHCNYISISNRYGQTWGSCVTSSYWGFNFGTDFNDDTFWVGVEAAPSCPSWTPHGEGNYAVGARQGMNDNYPAYQNYRQALPEDCLGGYTPTLTGHPAYTYTGTIPYYTSRTMLSMFLWSPTGWSNCNHLTTMTDTGLSWGSCINKHHFGYGFGPGYAYHVIRYILSQDTNCAQWWE